MARIPAVSVNCGFAPFLFSFIAKFAAFQTKPSSVAVLEPGSCRFQSRWLSFQEGLRFSTHSVARWKAETVVAPSKLGLEAFVGSPSNCCAGYPFAAQ